MVDYEVSTVQNVNQYYVQQEAPADCSQVFARSWSPVYSYMDRVEPTRKPYGNELRIFTASFVHSLQAGIVGVIDDFFPSSCCS